MLITCSCCENPKVTGDDKNPPADAGTGFLVTRIVIHDDVTTIEVNDQYVDGPRKVRRVPRIFMENAGLIWNQEKGFWSMPDGRLISSGYACFGKGTNLCIIRDGKAWAAI